jgi:Ankyrin repeats (3 copies)
VMRGSSIFLVLAVVTAACGVQSREADRCAVLQPPVSTPALLNAIGEGRLPELVACGMAPDQPIAIDGQTITPLQLAAGHDNPGLVRQIVQAGADPNFAGTDEIALPPLEVALTSRKYATARALLDLGARADYMLPHSGSTALMTVAVDTSTSTAAASMAKALIAKGAAVNTADSRGNTPLHWSARFGNAEYAKALLDLGADACWRNHKSQRAADVAPADQPALRDRLIAACVVPRRTIPHSNQGGTPR